MASGDTKTNQYLDIAANGTRADLPSDTCCETRTQTLIRGVAERVIGVEEEVERLENNPDVVDIVATYQDLQNYDTSGLTDKDIIRVLEDSTHNNNSTYYRWNSTTNQFDYIGEAGGGGPTVVQTTGTSTTDVMSQNATTSMVFNDPSTQRHIKIGSGASLSLAANGAVAIGRSSKARGDTVSIGYGAGSTDAGRSENVNIGPSANCGSDNSVALGYDAKTTRNGEVNIGSGNNPFGYNNTNYRVLGGVHDPVDAHDAATKGYVDANASAATFYSSVDPTVAANNVSLYSDKACTNAIQTSAFFQAIRSGKTVSIEYGGSGEVDSRLVYQVVYAVITNVDTADAYDEVGPSATYFVGSGTKTINAYDIDPSATNGFSII